MIFIKRTHRSTARDRTSMPHCVGVRGFFIVLFRWHLTIDRAICAKEKQWNEIDRHERIIERNQIFSSIVRPRLSHGWFRVHAETCRTWIGTQQNKMLKGSMLRCDFGRTKISGRSTKTQSRAAWMGSLAVVSHGKEPTKWRVDRCKLIKTNTHLNVFHFSITKNTNEENTSHATSNVHSTISRFVFAPLSPVVHRSPFFFFFCFCCSTELVGRSIFFSLSISTYLTFNFFICWTPLGAWTLNGVVCLVNGELCRAHYLPSDWIWRSI